MLKVLKQRRKGFLSNLTKTINRAEMSIENKTNISEIALLRENAEFSIFKLQENLGDSYLHASGAETTKAQQIFNENNERANRVIIRCERLIRQLDDDKQTKTTIYVFDQLCKSRSSKGSKYSGSSSRTSNDSDRSEKQRLLAIHNEDRATRNFELLKMKKKLKEVESNEQLKQANEKRVLLEVTSVSNSELEDVMNELPNIDNEPKVRHSSSYFVPRNIPKSNIDPEQHLKQSPQTLQNVRSTNSYMPRSPPTPPPKPSILKTTKLYNRNTTHSINSFTDTLIEGSETVINTTIDQSSSTMALLERDLESCNLPPIELQRFNGNLSHWREYIQYFKERVHMKRTFSDSLRMERLLSVLDGDAKRVVSALGRNGLLHATALNAFKREFGNPYVVSFLKLKTVLDQSQIQTDIQKGLKQVHQQPKKVITWLTSMEYLSSINSTKNVTKVVMRLPKTFVLLTIKVLMIRILMKTT